MALTIRDVARAAGVSTATVSRALRGLDNVDPATRDRVVRIAREMKFSVSPSASRLATGRTGSIAIVTPFLGGWYFTELFAGMEAALQRFDVDLLLHATGMPGVTAHPLRAHERVRRRVDGVLVLGMPLEMVESEGLFELDVPVVLLGLQAPGVPSVSIDDRLAARMAVEHLVERGHKRIGLISGRPLPTMFVPENDRLAGYLEVLVEHGLSVDETLREPGDFKVAGGEQAMERLLSLRPGPTAVFAMSDEMAYGALRAMRRRGVEPGKDIAIIGFDGHDLADTFDLSTVRQPVRDLGKAAGELLMERIAAGSLADAEVAPILLPTQLYARGSTGC
ncbi:LacI family DNA-binding transcriptional regulator [Jatrophihabitans sp.]|uniref:LacI family DNA-binding transcriptional regulator n=1 Tax=Jatrophihabitans sp. TaxID=1932789 RepID=UPI0030C71537|nr:LacI family transcriptional regulator [Jatrophihabitans sp.]